MTNGSMADRRPASALRLARVRAGWRITDLAAAVGLKNRSSLYRIEAGRTKRPRLKTRERLAAALGVREADLFGK